jgi:hypothetical protein
VREAQEMHAPEHAVMSSVRHLGQRISPTGTARPQVGHGRGTLRESTLGAMGPPGLA